MALIMATPSDADDPSSGRGWSSLKTRVTLFTLAISLIGILAMAIYASRMLREDMQRMLGEQQFSTVSYVAAEVDEEMDERLRAMKAVATDVTPVLLGNAAAMQAFLEQHPVLQRLFNGGTFIARIDGTTAAAVPLVEKRASANYMDSDFIATTLKEGAIAVVRPVMDQKLRDPHFVIAVTIRDAQGKVIGALAGVTDLSMPNLLDKIVQSHYGKTGGYMLVAPQYRLIITSTNKSHSMAALPAPGINTEIDRFVEGYEGSAVYVDPLGVEQLASVKGVPLAGWYVSATLPTAEAFAPIRDIQQRMLIATIFFTLLAGGLTWLMLRRQLLPMFAAMKTLASLSDANQPPQPLPITSQDEIGELIVGFNRLLNTLAQREAALKESAQKQQQLSEQISHYADEIADLYEHAPCGYHSLDQTGCFQHINETELNWLGYTWNEVVGKLSLADLLSPDSILIFQRTFSQLKKLGEVHDSELELIRKDGTILPVMISETAVYDADENFTMSRSTVYDMTERKKIEHERIGYLKRLEDASRHLVAAQEDARRRLSSELHDRTSPNLAAININLNIIVTELPQEHSADFAERLEDTRALIADTAASIRDICADMRPPLLDYAGLAAALDSYAQQFARRTGIAVQFDCANNDARYQPELESLLFRIFQEALTNCAKHANATQAFVTLSQDRHSVALTITDNGVGFDTALLGKTGPIGLGILNMREMAGVAGGRFSVESAPGKGTRINVEFSLVEDI